MKLTILFVDDDANIIGGLKRMMHPMRAEWELLYANGGRDALEMLTQKKVDVIISDIRMPGMDGTQLLTEVKEKYPQIVRITLSGYANDSLAMRNTRIVHQSLSKPTTPEIVRQTIERAHKLRQKLNNDDLLSIVNGIDDLPSLPEIYMKLEEEINSPNSSIDKIASIISKDPIITAKILQLTNSAFFGLPNRISNMNQALNFLGIKLIQNLVLSIKLFRSIEPNNPNAKFFEQIWQHSNYVAFMAQKIAQLKQLSKTEVEDSFLGGLLHDIGKLILIDKIRNIKISNDLKLTEYESQFSQITHADIGAYLLGTWGLPDAIVEAVAYHHSRESIFGDAMIPPKIVCLANKIVNNTDLTPLDVDKNKFDELLNEYGACKVEGNN